MNAAEFKSAFALAKTNEDLSNEDISMFDGFALKNFTPIACTERQVAALMRWQARYFNGNWDSEALTEIKNNGRRRFTVVK